MKIVFCANTSWYLYNYRKNLIIEIQKRGHKVYAISPCDRYSQKLQALDVIWFHIPMRQTSKNPVIEIRTLGQFWSVIKEIHPNFLLTFTIKCNLYAGLLNRICKFKQIANISGLGEVFEKQNFLNTGIRYLYRSALKKSQKVFFQNDEDLHLFTQQHILSEKLCERLPGSGVDLSTFKPPSTPNSHKNTRVFLMFGRVIPNKGYDLFLEAAQRIKNIQNHDAEFWILGIQDTSRRDSLKLFKRIIEFHNRKIIRYFPATDDVVPIIQQSDVVVLPSRYNEGVPRSLLEAMACGKPIITTDWKGCRDVVDNGVNGYLMEVSNLQALEKCLKIFIHSDEEALQKMGEASRKKAEREFDENIIISKYLAEIQS